MDVFLFLNRRAATIRGIEQFITQLVDHSLFTASARVDDDPANRERGAAIGIHFDRHLVVGAADAARLDLTQRLDALDGYLEQFELLVAALLLQLATRLIEDPLC